MLRSGHADAAWFTPEFLSQAPVSKIDEILAGIANTAGTFKSLEFTPVAFVAHFERGTDDILIHLNGDNLIDGLLFKPVKTASLDGALRGLASAGSIVSYVVQEGRSQRAALDPTLPLAVGSTFKLAVLNAIRDRVARGTLHWSDVFPLRGEAKSLPSGVLQTWPTGIPITVATYAAEMISISDNTAADALIGIAGQAGIKPYAGVNRPFLTTREMFALKSKGRESLRAAYLGAKTEHERAAVLKRVDALPLGSVERYDMTTPILGIEWKYSVIDLCRMMASVASLPAFSINPGVARFGDFRAVAYKGGSDTGVMSMTTLVTTKRGTRVCFSATANNPERPIDETQFSFAYQAVIEQIRRL